MIGTLHCKIFIVACIKGMPKNKLTNIHSVH